MLSKVLAAAAFYTDLNLSTFFCPCSLLFLFFLLSPLPDVHAPPLCCILASLSYHIIRWRLSGMHSYNPEQIMLSAAVRRSSRDLNIMKEKLIFSGKGRTPQTGELHGLCLLYCVFVSLAVSQYSEMASPPFLLSLFIYH
uniref:Uncharacterized protein n=1 Tax=Hucho hucho TaxID=62062 RepID=A0A4W5MAB5_9TELE